MFVFSLNIYILYEVSPMNFPINKSKLYKSSTLNYNQWVQSDLLGFQFVAIIFGKALQKNKRIYNYMYAYPSETNLIVQSWFMVMLVGYVGSLIRRCIR